ncbi:MAG: hypothetical protein RRY40_02475 [Oscillospiraceae bacterium]
MGFNNFIPTVWASKIEKQLERLCVFSENCNRQYEGDVKSMGDSVRILGIGKPTITETTEKAILLTDAEVIEDTAVTMNINHIAHFNYMVDDIDKRQEKPEGIMQALSAETSEGLANVVDRYIAGLAGDKMAFMDTTDITPITKDNILGRIDSALSCLYKNDVAMSTRVTLTVSPHFYMLLKQAYAALDTNNTNLLKNGRVGMYGNVEIKMSNNVLKDGDKGEKAMLRTDRAIAFVQPLTHIEAYRPEKKFSDAMKGFILYDAKIVRPRELVVMNVKY